MKYEPVLRDEQVKENHDMFDERRIFYKEKGMDFVKSREFILEKAGPLKGRILEIGCGKGIMALFLARTGYIFSSIDKSEEALQIAALNLAYEKLLSRVRLYVMDAYSLEFDNESFNNIFLVEALHHMDDLEGLFSEVDRVLSPGGKLVLADFNEKGMKIVGSVHGSEGRHHASSPIGAAEAENWLGRKRYEVERHDDECHWVLVARKGQDARDART